jgi:hypothetical protein
MDTFGVETWDEVLSFFHEGGALAGLWGWLEVLRRAQDGDFVSYEMALRFQWPSVDTGWAFGDPWNGGYFARDEAGSILVNGQAHSHFATAHTELYSLWRRDSLEPTVWSPRLFTWAGMKHYHTRFDSSSFDEVDALLDVIGIGAEFFPVLQPVGYASDVFSVIKASVDLTEDPGMRGAFGLTVDLFPMMDIVMKGGGALPGVGMVFDMTTLGMNVADSVVICP